MILRSILDFGANNQSMRTEPHLTSLSQSTSEHSQLSTSLLGHLDFMFYRPTTMKVIQNKFTFACMASSVRMISGLTTSIHLKDPTLLRVPEVTFHRESLQVFDPAATNKQINDGSAVIALVEAMDRTDAKKAIDKSAEALEKWKFKTTGLERSQMLSRWSELITEHTDDLGRYRYTYYAIGLNCFSEAFFSFKTDFDILFLLLILVHRSSQQ